jgi:hypothetical protein
MTDRRTFIVHLTPEPDCTVPIKALRELLKRALRTWGLRCVALSEVNGVAEGLARRKLAAGDTGKTS